MADDARKYFDEPRANQAHIDLQIAKWISNGYSLDDIYITPCGSVIYDPTAAEAAAFRDFGKKPEDGRCSSGQTQVPPHVLQQAVPALDSAAEAQTDSIAGSGTAPQSGLNLNDIPITADELQEEPAVTAVQSPPEFYYDGETKLDLVIGCEENLIFIDYMDYVSGNHGVISPRYKLLRVNSLPNVGIYFPALSPCYDRISDAELVQSIQSVPDARMISAVTVVDFPHRDELWMRHQLNAPKAKIYGEVRKSNLITLYRPSSLEQTISTMHHEWWHIVRFTNPEAGRIFDLAGEIESSLVANSGRNLVENKDEKWSDLGQALTGEVPEVSVMTAMVNPVKACVFGKILNDILIDVPISQRSPNHGRFSQLVIWINAAVKPEAIKQIESSREEITLVEEEVLQYVKGC